MTRRFAFLSAALLLVLLSRNAGAQNWAAQQPPYGRPDATIDLRTSEGVQLVKGRWRYSDVKIINVDFRGPGADLDSSSRYSASIWRPLDLGVAIVMGNCLGQ